jgi:hypothetical protein
MASGKISNKELWQKTNQPPVEEELKRRKWRWIGYTPRKPKHSITSKPYSGTLRENTDSLVSMTCTFVACTHKPYKS